MSAWKILSGLWLCILLWWCIKEDDKIISVDNAKVNGTVESNQTNYKNDVKTILELEKEMKELYLKNDFISVLDFIKNHTDKEQQGLFFKKLILKSIAENFPWYFTPQLLLKEFQKFKWWIFLDIKLWWIIYSQNDANYMQLLDFLVKAGVFSQFPPELKEKVDDYFFNLINFYKVNSKIISRFIIAYETDLIKYSEVTWYLEQKLFEKKQEIFSRYWVSVNSQERDEKYKIAQEKYNEWYEKKWKKIEEDFLLENGLLYNPNDELEVYNFFEPYLSKLPNYNNLVESRKKLLNYSWYSDDILQLSLWTLIFIKEIDSDLNKSNFFKALILKIRN